MFFEQFSKGKVFWLKNKKDDWLGLVGIRILRLGNLEGKRKKEELT